MSIIKGELAYNYDEYEDGGIYRLVVAGGTPAYFVAAFVSDRIYFYALRDALTEEAPIYYLRNDEPILRGAYSHMKVPGWHGFVFEGAKLKNVYSNMKKKVSDKLYSVLL